MKDNRKDYPECIPEHTEPATEALAEQVQMEAEACVIGEAVVMIPMDHYRELISDSVKLGILKKAVKKNTTSYLVEDLMKILFDIEDESADDAPGQVQA